MSDQDLPSPPFIFVPGVPNFRDIGGYPVAAQPGRVVRRGLVFRSARPNDVTPAGIDKLRALRIARVYDLRSKPEIEKDEARARALLPQGGQGGGDGAAAPMVKEWAGAERVFAPVFLDEDYSPAAIAKRFKDYASQGSEGFVEAYKAILSSGSSPENASQPFKTILNDLASAAPAPTPLLLHCSAGKDRTGVICALILALCGVDDDVVAHEYSLTDLGFREKHPSVLEQLKNEPALANDVEAAKRMLSSRKDNLQSTLGWIRTTYGSVEDCVIKLGLLSPEGIDRLRGNLVVDAGDEAPVDWQRHAEILEHTKLPVSTSS